MNNKDSNPGKRGLPPIAYILLAALGFAAWRLLMPKPDASSGLLPSLPTLPGLPSGIPGTAQKDAGSLQPAAAIGAFPRQATVPAGTTIRIDGSTSMVLINEALKAGFQRAYPGTNVESAAVGSDNGIQALLGGDIQLAAISRPLSEEERGRGLAAIPVAKDRIAIVVGEANPFQRGLSRDQVVQIFQGRISNWATLGGADRTIRVFNRPVVSGTHSAFRTIVLGGADFGTTPNITTLARDATTPLLRMLGADGIGYATYTQVADQQTVRVMAIDGLTPEAPAYPFQRPLFYAFRAPADPAVKAFLGFALSPEGKAGIQSAMKGP